MRIKVFTFIYLSVEDHDMAEAACSSINTGLIHQMDDFPDGDVVGIDVDRYELVADTDEAAELFGEQPNTEVTK